MRFGVGLAVVLLGVAVTVTGSLCQANAGVATQRQAAGDSPVVEAIRSQNAADVSGCGFGEWWQKHGQQVVEFAGCMLDGMGLARLLIAGVSGVGGVIVAAGLAVGALACLA